MRLSILVSFFYCFFSWAAESGKQIENFANNFFWIAVLLLIAKIFSLVEKAKQPAVLGELIAGIILGNLYLLGINYFEPIKSSEIIKFLAELGVVILLFQIGLESNVGQMIKVGGRSLAVAVVGVVVPFLLGTYLVAPLILPGLDKNEYLFLGAALTATSVGITARVFRDLGKSHIPEAKIILGAAVIDDILGLIILAIVSAIVTVGSVSGLSVLWIIVKAILFLLSAIIIGQLLAPSISKIFSRINTGVGMKFTLALVFGLVGAFVASKIGLAPIVGAFAAGLVLDPVHFKFFNRPKIVEEIEKSMESIKENAKNDIKKIIENYEEKHIEDLIEPISHFLVPIFFITIGMSVDIKTLLDLKTLILALGITLTAFIGKYVSGLVAGKVNKSLVGLGMVPRGEVGLIFVTIGQNLGVVSSKVFSVVVIMIIITTLITPPLISAILARYREN
ncbi:MAG: cation:proton antiporter [Patescibacteria group bacterium]|nr:cation:proton antiporter [Patescibacteria group bacterium]